jgi:hypothetical protein
MTETRALATPGLGVPAINLRTIATMLVAGAVATIAFDFFGHALAPMLGFANLAPVPLATQVWGVVFGASYAPGGHFLHYAAGLVAYPLGWMFLWRPFAERLAPPLPWLASAVLYGVALWVFALFVMAHLVAGNPPFLNFAGITWVALVGHVLFAVIVAWVERRRRASA